jgi:putative ABC transport system ATP-binding protein
MNLIVAENLGKRYGNGEAAVDALSRFSFDVSPGELLAIMGESGSGKSTLLSILGGMNAPSSGRLVVDGIDIYGLDPDRRADFRREYLGFIFQSFHLVPYLTVGENVMLPFATGRMGKKEKRERAEAALSDVGLEGKFDRLPSDISGGEKERAAIARAIVNAPEILLADEPTGSLDSKTSREVMQLLSRINAKGTTVLMVTHSAECAAYARRIIRVADGALAGDDPTEGICIAREIRIPNSEIRSNILN